MVKVDSKKYLAIFQMESFEHEGDCYLWFIPKLQAMRSEKNLKPLAFPKGFYASVENSIIILENMKAQNYDVVPKKVERKSCSEVFRNQGFLRVLGTKILLVLKIFVIPGNEEYSSQLRN